VLGQVLELNFGVDLTIGPALEEGFYYDCFMGEKVGKRSYQCSRWQGTKHIGAADGKALSISVQQTARH
jgi:threonyl-tRNA synthetase